MAVLNIFFAFPRQIRLSIDALVFILHPVSHISIICLTRFPDLQVPTTEMYPFWLDSYSKLCYIKWPMLWKAVSAYFLSFLRFFLHSSLLFGFYLHNYLNLLLSPGTMWVCKPPGLQPPSLDRYWPALLLSEILAPVPVSLMAPQKRTVSSQVLYLVMTPVYFLVPPSTLKTQTYTLNVQGTKITTSNTDPHLSQSASHCHTAL